MVGVGEGGLQNTTQQHLHRGEETLDQATHACFPQQDALKRAQEEEDNDKGKAKWKQSKGRGNNSFVLGPFFSK